MKVMVVDDDAVTLEVVSDRLRNAGYDVIPRNHALGTAAAVQQEDPDVVLLDVNMPALLGDSLARLIDTRRGPSGGPAIILHSSKSAQELAALVDGCGAVGAITKTGNDAAFFADLRRCLERARRLGWRNRSR